MYQHESGATKRARQMTEKIEPNQFWQNYTSWLQKRGSDTESLVTDDVEIGDQS